MPENCADLHLGERYLNNRGDSELFNGTLRLQGVSVGVGNSSDMAAVMKRPRFEEESTLSFSSIATPRLHVSGVTFLLRTPKPWGATGLVAQ